jgi:hypothetical protein
MLKNSRIVADKSMEQAIREVLEDAGILEIKNTIIIQSPILIQQQKKKRWDETLVEVFPLWLEYYNHHRKFNNPWKIIVVGIESQYQDLPYYVTPVQNEQILGGIEKLLKTDTIDYSQIPGTCSGKDYISVFFHGHGEENIKGLLGKITDYLRNGILMIREGAALEEVKEIFFTPAAEHLEQLLTRLKKYQPLLEYLPWEEEIRQLKQMITLLEDFLIQPGEQKASYDEIVEQVNLAYESISLLMKIHKIK